MSALIKFKNSILLCLFLSLFFVMSLEHTIAIRNSLFFTLLVALLFYLRGHRQDVKTVLGDATLKRILWILLGTTLYIVLHALFVSHETAWALQNVKGHWLLPLCYFLMGGLLVIVLQEDRPASLSLLLTALFFVLFAQVVYLDVFVVVKWVQAGHLISREGAFMMGVANTGYITNMAAAMLLAEGVYRLRSNDRVLRFGNRWLCFFLFLILVASIEEALRWGSFVLLLLGVISLVLFFYKRDGQRHGKQKLKITFFSLLFLSVVSAPLVYNFLTDARWKSLLETVPIALNLKKNYNWLSSRHAYPKLSNGKFVSDSNYKRVAWMKEGVNLIIDNPWGVGFGRDAFGHALSAKYPNSGVSIGSHSHSSVIDFTVGVGVLGFLIWLVFIVSVLKFALYVYKRRVNYYSLFLLLVTSDFFLRSFVDSNMRDHMFQQAMLLLGVGLVAVFRESQGREVTHGKVSI